MVNIDKKCSFFFYYSRKTFTKSQPKQGSWPGSLANSYAQDGSKGNSSSISVYLPAVV